MKTHYSNIVLIGMPGAGKSTIGVLLAKHTSRGFIDTDLLIQTSQQRSLQDIVDMDGYAVLRKLEEETLLGLKVHDHIISTGGSAVYSDQAMQHLKSDGLLVYLEVDLVTLRARIGDFGQRGLARPVDQSLEALFSERSGLYEHYADITVSTVNLTPEEVCTKIITDITTFD